MILRVTTNLLSSTIKSALDVVPDLLRRLRSWVYYLPTRTLLLELGLTSNSAAQAGSRSFQVRSRGVNSRLTRGTTAILKIQTRRRCCALPPEWPLHLECICGVPYKTRSCQPGSHGHPTHVLSNGCSFSWTMYYLWQSHGPQRSQGAYHPRHFAHHIRSHHGLTQTHQQPCLRDHSSRHQE